MSFIFFFFFFFVYCIMICVCSCFHRQVLIIQGARLEVKAIWMIDVFWNSRSHVISNSLLIAFSHMLFRSYEKTTRLLFWCPLRTNERTNSERKEACLNWVWGERQAHTVPRLAVRMDKIRKLGKFMSVRVGASGFYRSISFRIRIYLEGRK